MTERTPVDVEEDTYRLGKNLWTDALKGEPLRVYEAPTDSDEARFIVEEVQQLNCEGVRLSEMALLYRSNVQSRVPVTLWSRSL